ncbi:FMN-binding protein [Arthrobacter sp. NPDC090010]|uniref:FMN-binding protein n=1 Tax=Arthrobacter sp. NPDC090010 TaxID=3363942 RepID=UPI003828D488
MQQTHPPAEPTRPSRGRSLLPVGLAAAAGGIAILVGCAPAKDASVTEPQAQPSAQGSTAASHTTGHYKNGTYSADGHYVSPNGEETVGVTLTLSAGKITDVNITPHPTSANTQLFQNRFAGGIKDLVVGKSIDELDVSRVAGSSLTSGGFNDAVEAIKKQAG